MDSGDLIFRVGGMASVRLRECPILENGLPSHGRFGRQFRLLEPATFGRVFEVFPDDLGGDGVGVLAIDGKTRQRSFDRAAGRAPLRVVTAFDQIIDRAGRNTLRIVRHRPRTGGGAMPHPGSQWRGPFRPSGAAPESREIAALASLGMRNATVPARVRQSLSR